jgi:peptidoglycan hydrolase-like protein with peptidoglycan-binding domain
MRRSFVLVSSLTLLLLGLAPTTAAAQGATSVTLSVSPHNITFGETATLSGTIDPPSADETVEIRDEAGATLAIATTDANGDYSTDLSPDRSMDVHALWQTVASDPVHIAVHAVVTTHLGDVRLFGTAAVRGTISPARPGEQVGVTVTLSGDVLATLHPVVATDGTYATTFPVRDTGAYRVHVVFSDRDLRPGTADAGPISPRLPSLRRGSRNDYVELLERRLRSLRYRLVGVDRRYGESTADAVLAFRKVQGMRRLYTVDARVWRALIDPRKPRPRADMRRFHIEVDQTRQILYTVEDRAITSISHVSTGKPSTPTRNGSFRVYRKVAGLTGGGLYYPSYFDGLRALHGYVEVPTYAASHGCVRIPYWNAKWVYRHAPIGTRVIVYGAVG